MTPNQFGPLLVSLVGLPGRGKSLLARRLARYLIYTGDNVKILDISEYRRRRYKNYSSHEMFKADNFPAWEVRQQSFHEALDDSVTWLCQPGRRVAILDGPNVCRNQRLEIYRIAAETHNFRVMFVECVCEDPTMLERNFKEILRYSVDYKDMSKMAHYQAQYESPSLGSHWELPCPMIKLLDDGFGGVIGHGITGPREAVILGYISSPKQSQQVLYFSRHGESEFNVIGRIGGDASLSPRGRKYAHALAQHIHALNLPSLQVWTSSLRRTKLTSQLIQAPQIHLAELDEIYSGKCENLTYEELHERFPGELASRDQDKLSYRYPQGESYVDVMKRLVPILMQLECEQNILTISHQAVLRCLLGYFLQTPPKEIPYMHVPLHTIIKLSLNGYSYGMETVKMPIDCVDTNRPKPANCSADRSMEEVLTSVPRHFDSMTT